MATLTPINQKSNDDLKRIRETMKDAIKQKTMEPYIFNTVDKNRWLTDEVIDFYMYCFLANECYFKVKYISSVNVKATFSYVNRHNKKNYALNEPSRMDHFVTLLGLKEMPILEQDYTVINFNLNNDHWISTCYVTSEDIIYVYDSLAESNKERAEKEVKVFLSILRDILGILKETKIVSVNFIERQPGGWQCGYYVILFNRIITNAGKLTEEKWNHVKRARYAPILSSIEFWDILQLGCYYNYVTNDAI